MPWLALKASVACASSFGQSALAGSERAVSVRARSRSTDFPVSGIYDLTVNPMLGQGCPCRREIFFARANHTVGNPAADSVVPFVARPMLAGDDEELMSALPCWMASCSAKRRCPSGSLGVDRRMAALLPRGGS